MSFFRANRHHEDIAGMTQNSNSRSDRIADSVVMLLAMTLLQRSMGFVRGVLFCRWLPAEELGQWDMAWGFIELAAPLAMLGLPGSFGRYVEYYRRQDHLRIFLRRTTIATASIACVTLLLMVANARSFSYLIFGTADKAFLILLVSLGLVAIIAYNFLTTLLTSLRRSRIVSSLEFANSALFATLAIGLVACWRADATSIIIAYSLACLVTAATSLRWLRPIWRTLPTAAGHLPHRELWSKLLPFAIWVWGTNWLANLFEVADRYMIVHCGGFDSVQAMVEVGNYHSSRVVPLLLVSVTGLLGTMMTPYLSHDWETGGARMVSTRMNFMLKILGMSLLMGAVVILIAAPVMFEVAFKGKFAGGQAVLPLTLAYCLWFGMTRVAQKYLWCAEHVRLAAAAWGVGLLMNIGLNFLLLPRLGLAGVVLSTVAGNVASLLTMYFFNMRHGMRIDGGTWLVSASPALLLTGFWPTVIGLAAIVLVAVSTSLVINAAEKQQLLDVWHDYFGRLRAGIERRTDTALKGAS